MIVIWRVSWKVYLTDSIGVQIMDCGQHVAHKLGSTILAEDKALILPAVQKLEELPASAQVSHNVDGTLAEEDILQLHDIRMVQTLQDANLRVKFAQVVRCNAVHIHNLNSALIACDTMRSKVDRPIATLAQLAASVNFIHLHTNQRRGERDENAAHSGFTKKYLATGTTGKIFAHKVHVKRAAKAQTLRRVHKLAVLQ